MTSVIPLQLITLTFLSEFHSQIGVIRSIINILPLRVFDSLCINLIKYAITLPYQLHFWPISCSKQLQKLQMKNNGFCKCGCDWISIISIILHWAEINFSLRWLSVQISFLSKSDRLRVLYSTNWLRFCVKKNMNSRDIF